MTIRVWLCALAVLVSAVTTCRAEAVYTSTARDRTAVEVTVYNDNLGLVKETRKVNLGKGMGELRFMDVASAIMPVTVHVKSLDNPEGFTILEQNYEYDLMNAGKLLDKYVGKKIKLIEWNKFQDRKEEVDATLLSNNRGQIFRIGDKIYLGHPGIRVLPRLPEDLIAKPTLTWLFETKDEKPRRLQVSYLTRKMRWNADYVLVLDKEDKTADLSGWVTLDNKSGATYRNASLKLVAGTVHRAKAPPRPRALAAAPMMEKSRRRAFTQKAFFEYHIYDLQRRTTIKDKQTKQVSLLEAEGIEVDKELLLYGNRYYFMRQYRERNPKQKVGVFIKFKNTKKNHLGMPLPAGIMRLYKNDQDGSQQFIGEDRIDHTPKDEEVKLKIGEAFDVVAERLQVDYKRLTAHMHESEWEIKIRNHKDKPVKVGIIEPLFPNWKMLSNSHPYKKLDAFSIRFDLSVPKDGEAKVKYRVRVGY